MQTIFTTQAEWGRYYTTAVIGIDAVPARLPQQLIPSLFAGCEAPGTSLEICCLPDERERGRVRLLLLLRRSSRSPQMAAGEARVVRDALLERLTRAGFQAAALGGEDCAALAKRLSRRANLTLCYPGEDLRRVRSCYAPGGYDALAPIDPADIFGALAGREDAGFSVQLSAARMLPEEAQMIRDNLEWLSGQMERPDAGQATRAFQAALALADAPLCFVSITLWGDDSAMALMLPSLRQRGFDALTVPRDLLARADYLSDAADRLCDFAAANAHATAQGVQVPRNCWRLNHLATPRMVNALLIPRQDIPVPAGLKVNRVPPDRAPLPPAFTGEGVELGRRAGDGQEVRVPLDRWSKHAVVVGMPGTGKTTFAFLLLSELRRCGVPFLAIEPAKTEYRALMDAIPDLKVYTPGNSGVAPLLFNPFMPPARVTLEKYLPGLETAFLTAFSLFSPLDVIFPEVLRTCYTRYGWRMDSTRESPEARPFGMHEFIAVFREEAKNSGYDGESRANLESGGVYRFQSLLNANSVLFDTDRPLPTDELLKRPVLIELDAIGNPEQKSLLLSLLLIQLNLVIRRDQVPDGKLKNVIMIDEAHVLLGQQQKAREARDADPTGRTVAFLQQMVLENRAYGSGMIFADQSPYKLTPEIVGNADIQLIFRLNSADDRRMLGDNMNLPRPLVDAIEALPTGQCYLQAQGLDAPVRLITPDSRERLKLRPTLPDDEVHARYGGMPAPFTACPCQGCDMAVRSMAEFIARSITDAHRAELSNAEGARRFIKEGMMCALGDAVDGKPGRDRLYGCAKLFLARRVGDMLASISGRTAAPDAAMRGGGDGA